MKKHLMIMATVMLCISFYSCSRKGEPSSAGSKHRYDLMAEPKIKIRTIGILLYDGFATLDAMGPHHVLSELVGTQVFFIAKERGIVKSANGVSIEVTRSIGEIDSLDILVVPGGLEQTYRASQDTALLKWIRKIDQTTIFTTSVCTGAWILEQAGILKDKSATTHWYGKKMLRDRGIDVKDQRWVQDGKYWTSAGVTAGMDMSLALINEIRGEEYTKAAMLDLEYDPKPPFHGGAEENTNEEIVKVMRQLYDQGMENAKKPIPPPSTRSLGVDPICGMEVSESSADTASYQGKHYAFCSKSCMVTFVKNPQIFLARKQ